MRSRWSIASASSSGSWTRLSDDWTDRAELARLSFEDRWHYLALIQMCSRGGHVTGVLRVVDPAEPPTIQTLLRRSRACWRSACWRR